MRDWLKGVCHLVFGTVGTVVELVNTLATALHEVPFAAVNDILDRSDGLVCDAVDGLFDAVKGAKDSTPD